MNRGVRSRPERRWGAEMDRMRRSGWLAAVFGATLVGGAAFAQSTPDPLAPGAGAEAAKDEPKAASDPAAPEKPEKPAPHKRAREAHAEAGGFAVTVHNDRSVGMKELQLGPAGSQDLKKMVGPLAFGRKTVIHVKRTKDCLYDIHAEFADDADTDQTGVDLCKDKAINLTD